jgi:hypothetical protein
MDEMMIKGIDGTFGLGTRPTGALIEKEGRKKVISRA